MPLGIEYWPDRIESRDVIHEERLQAALGVDFFRQPPPYHDDEHDESIIALKFPSYHHCPKCKYLTDDFDRVDRKRDGTVCPLCNHKYMTPSRFIAACIQGHAQDFPYREWVHRGPIDCAGPLKMIFLGKSAGLRDIWILCECGAKRSMEGAFSKDGLKKVGADCLGCHPWRPDDPRVKCNESLRALQRGASNFYFTEIRSSLAIPPWDSRIAEILNFYRMTYRTEFDPTDDDHLASLRMLLRNRPSWKNISTEDINSFIEKKQPLIASAGYDLQHFKQQEFHAFSEGISSDAELPRFVVRESDVPGFLSRIIDKVVLADVLEEVRALVGFRRISPFESIDDDDPRGNFVSIRSPAKSWLPGIRIAGEGIFIQFNTKELDSWSSLDEVQERIGLLKAGIESIWEDTKRVGDVEITPRLIFLHSFAHVIINRLSLKCGYSSGALRERIYSGVPSDPESADMAGVLIYTGSVDSEGTLGGLVGLGEPEQLGLLIEEAIRNAAWCSSDPICTETINPGERTMNLAACHACMFVPETSCEFFNSLLDRISLVGDLEGKGGFLGFLTR